MKNREVFVLDFRAIELGDKEQIENYTRQQNYFMCTYCFTDLFIWQLHYGTEFAVENDMLYLRGRRNGEYYYLCPLGKGDLRTAVKNIEKLLSDNSQRIEIFGIPEAKKEELEEILGNGYEFTETPDSEDYIYIAEKMATLAGRKLHSKRNFINRFKADYEGRWSYEELTEENMHEVFEFHIKWCDEKDPDKRDEYIGETQAISAALKNFKALGIKGGILRVDGDIAAYTLGSQSNDDMYTIHIEKATSSINGTYQMINQQFAEANFEGIMYVDREEDLGIEGLKKAKMSYYPDKRGVCYMMRKRSDV